MIMPPARLVWPEVDDKTAKCANADTQGHGKDQDRRAKRQQYLHEL